jgi:DNA-binding NtrC family response regulator
MRNKPGHYALLAEDDYAFRWALAIELERNGFDLDVAENATEAIELLEVSGRHCCLIVDLRMPSPGGVAVVEKAKALRPDLPVVVVTGYPDEATSLGTPMILAKPVATDVVRRVAAAACRQPLHQQSL